MLEAGEEQGSGIGVLQSVLEPEFHAMQSLQLQRS